MKKFKVKAWLGGISQRLENLSDEEFSPSYWDVSYSGVVLIEVDGDRGWVEFDTSEDRWSVKDYKSSQFNPTTIVEDHDLWDEEETGFMSFINDKAAKFFIACTERWKEEESI